MGQTKLLGVLIVAMAVVALAQQPNPQTPEDAFTTRELIAWSQLQRPQPMPQPVPPSESPIPRPEQPQDQKAKPPADSHTQQKPAQWFAGTIIREGGRHLLRMASNTTYLLEDGRDLEEYESKNVRVFGEYNAELKTIHFLGIQVLS